MFSDQPQKVYRTELSPVSFLRRSACLYPGKTAIVHGRRRYSYLEFEQRVDRFANQLLKYRLRKQDRVAFIAPNIPAMLEAHFAVPAAGGILVTINTRLNTEEIGYIISHSGSKVIFVDSEYKGLLEKLDLSGKMIIEIKDSGIGDDPYEQFLAGGDINFEGGLPGAEEDPIALNYTSGTTGRPKGVIFTHRGAYLNALGEIIETRLVPDSVYLWTLPMFHCNGWCFTWAVTAVGGTHICLRKTDPGLVWDLIREEKVTHFNGAPTLHINLLNHAKASPVEHNIHVTIAGAPPSPTLLEKIREFNFKPIHVYGLTETYGPITICECQKEWERLTPQQQAEKVSRQGQAYITADLVRVVDENMGDVPKDGQTIGEVIMRGNIVMKEYYLQPEATANATLGGWFHSGDLAVWHPDGYIELRDRLKDIIISGGENISTIEIEQIVARHPAVLECAVVAIPDEKWGERPKAFVTLKRGARATEEGIINFCREHAAHFKCPAVVEFGDLPKTSTGKVQKYILREKEWKGKGKRIN